MKIAVLTNFTHSKEGYSLYHVAVSQADTFRQYGNEITVFVMEGYEQTQPLRHDCIVDFQPIIPKTTLIDYQKSEDLTEEHIEYSSNLADILTEKLEGFDVVFTHDWIFTGWNLPFFMALKQIAHKTRNLSFLHWVHSVPGFARDWWRLSDLGEENHRIVYPNRTSITRVANFFRTDPKKVFSIPPIEDLRYLLYFAPETLEVLKRFPGITEHLVIQIYPAGSDRLDAKGVRELIAVFSEIKKRGYSVFLLLINQAADDHDNQATMDHYKRFGEDRGLVYGEDFAFISDFFPGFAAGTPKRTVIELSMYSNVFVFPSQHETFGLVLPETSLVSGALPVLNKSLPEMLEVGGMHGLLVDFGSYFVEWKPKDEEAYFEHLAGQIIYMMHSEEGIRAKTWNRLEYNRASIYERYYVPILQGRNLWT